MSLFPTLEPVPDTFDLTYLSLGGGVQSSALLAMSAIGLNGVPRADVAIFADTQAETAATYAWLDMLTSWSAERRIPVVRCTRGDLAAAVLDRELSQIGQIPMFTKQRKEVRCTWCGGTRSLPGFGTCQRCGGAGTETQETVGMLPRHCTSNFKVDVIEKAVREQLGLSRGQRAKGVKRARALIGISRDEAHRMRTSKTEWITNSYPLVDARLSRADCVAFLGTVFGRTAPRSACYFCPFHSDAYWRELRDEHPAEWTKAIAFDAQLRRSRSVRIEEAYVHRSGKPLGEALGDAPDGYGNDCSGICGV